MPWKTDVTGGSVIFVLQRLTKSIKWHSSDYASPVFYSILLSNKTYWDGYLLV